MRTRFLHSIRSLLVLSVFFAGPALGQKKPGKTPAAVAKAEAKPPLEGFDQFVNDRLKEWKVPGVGIAVVKDGKLIYAQGFGFRDVKNNLPVTPNTLFAIGSCTKAFTAAAAGILVDEGKVKWDTPVREYLPSFKMYDDYVTEHMTPRDLVTHRSGLPRHDALWYNTSLTRREMFDRLRYLEANRGFRETYQYQNLMFMTAGHLVEHIAGESWEQFIQRKFLDPLEMKTSNFSVSVSQKAADFALPYQEKKDEVKEIPFRNIDAIGPAGSINSSVNEMANWVLLHLGKGKFKDKQLISEASLRETHTPQTTMPGPLQYDEVSYSSYGMGWAINFYRGHLRLSHGGGIDGFTALVSMLPRDNLGMVILANLSGTPLPSILANNLYDRLLGLSEVPWNQRVKEERAKAKEAQEKLKQQGDPNRKTGTQPSHPLKDFAGKFEHSGYGVLRVENEGEQLKVTYNNIPVPLKHYHYDIFQNAEDEEDKRKVTFLTNQKGEIDRVAVPLEASVKDIVFTRIPDMKAVEKSVLEKMAGEYVLEATGTKLTVSLRGETLYVFVPGQPEYELVPAKENEFDFKGLAGFSLAFKPDASGAYPEAVVTQPNAVFTIKRKP